MSDSAATVPSFDPLPRDTLCQCVSLLRGKWQACGVLGPRPLTGQSPQNWHEVDLRRRQLCERWQPWMEQTGLPLVASQVLHATALAARGAARELLRMDRDFDLHWDAPTRLRSRRAGAELLLACQGARHAGVLSRLQAELAAGRPCHWISAWSGLAAMFSLPPASASLAALFAEWEALDPWRREWPVGEAVAAFARDSGAPLARCEWIERRVRRSALRIA